MLMPFMTLRVKQTQGKRKEADIQTAFKKLSLRVKH